MMLQVSNNILTGLHNILSVSTKSCRDHVCLLEIPLVARNLKKKKKSLLVLVTTITTNYFHVHYGRYDHLFNKKLSHNRLLNTTCLYLLWRNMA